MDYKGIDYLKRKLAEHQGRAKARYKHYAMKERSFDPGLTIPYELKRQYQATMGWCTKGVDALADRLMFREFANDNFQVNQIFKVNNPDVFFDSLILSSLIGACAFVYIWQSPERELPSLQVIEATNATGILDPITGLLTEGYAVLKRDDNDTPVIEAYFTDTETVYYEKGKKPYSIPHSAGHALLVPVMHRPDAERPFGRSRITRAGMYYQLQAKRTLERSEVTAEFYSFPQKYVLGMDRDTDPLDTWKATVSSMIQITKDEDGDKPVVGQFTTASMTPFIEQLKMTAALFAGEMGLTLDDLGFVSDNPSSVEAIKASHENLRLAGMKAQRSLGSGLLNVAFVAACLRDSFAYVRSQFAEVVPKWEPLFTADANTLTLIGDGALKLNQAVEGYVTADTIRDLTGLKGAGMG